MTPTVVLRAIALAVALAGRPAFADGISLPVGSVYGSKTACEPYGVGGEHAVLSRFSDPLPPEPWTGVKLIVPDGIFYIDGRCTPIEVSGMTALLQCSIVDAEWKAAATFLEADDALTFSADFVSGDLDQLFRDRWPREVLGKCVIDEKG